MLRTITRVATQDAVAALTFDDGPHPVYTRRLLRILDRFHARATFFMVGESAQKYREVVEEVARAGHAIGNHSWDHPPFPLITGRERRQQIRACAQALVPYGQRLFRPPYGEQNLASRLDVWWLGYQTVTWNLDVGDWCNRDAQRMADAVASRLRPGSVLVFHDAIFDGGIPRLGPKPPREATVDRDAMLLAVGAVLERACPQYRFVTIPELLQAGRPRGQNWYRGMSRGC